MNLVSLNHDPKEMTELEKAKADMDFKKKKGGKAYFDAKRHYEKLQKKEMRYKMFPLRYASE